MFDVRLNNSAISKKTIEIVINKFNNFRVSILLPAMS